LNKSNRLVKYNTQCTKYNPEHYDNVRGIVRFLEVTQNQIRVVIECKSDNYYVYKPFDQIEQKSSKN